MIMKVVVLYRPNSEHGRTVESYVRDLEHAHHGCKVEMVSLDTRDGASTASLYDVMQYPAILALQDNGQLLKHWQGENLPLMNDVAYYASGIGSGIIGGRSTLSVFG
mgnify:CR=1 FL=1